ncbi:MAG: hypothetical protein ACT4PT_02810 [Methanobacteriota archaeon]
MMHESGSMWAMMTLMWLFWLLVLAGLIALVVLGARAPRVPGSRRDAVACRDSPGLGAEPPTFGARPAPAP